MSHTAPPIESSSSRSEVELQASMPVRSRLATVLSIFLRRKAIEASLRRADSEDSTFGARDTARAAGARITAVQPSPGKILLCRMRLLRGVAFPSISGLNTLSEEGSCNIALTISLCIDCSPIRYSATMAPSAEKVSKTALLPVSLPTWPATSLAIESNRRVSCVSGNRPADLLMPAALAMVSPRNV